MLALRDDQAQYFASSHAALSRNAHGSIPQSGMPARHVKECIVQQNQLDNKPRLNTSSYVNVITEPEEEDIILLGMATNLADASVYPASVRIHNECVNMIAKLWNAPEVEGDFSGAGTVGSTEACLLAGLALKFRWRSVRISSCRFSNFFFALMLCSNLGMYCSFFLHSGMPKSTA